MLTLRDPETPSRRLGPGTCTRTLASHRACVHERSREGQVLGTSMDVTERVEPEIQLGVRAHQQAAVARLGQRALEGADVGPLLEEAASLAAAALEVEYCEVLELLPDGKTLLLRAGVGWKPGLVGRATEGTERDSQAGYTLLADEPVVVEDLRTEQRFTGPPLLIDHRVVSGVSVIIRSTERPFGVLGAHTSTRRAFSREDVTFLESLAHLLATAIARRRAEQALATSEQRMSQVLRAAGAGAWEWNLATNEAVWSEENYRVLGLAPGSVRACHATWLERIHPEDRARAEACVHEAVAERKDLNIEFRVLWPDGTVHWVNDIGKMVCDPAGVPIGMYGIQIDITERKQAEQEIGRLNEELELRVAKRTEQLESANRELEAFTYSVSHDLRAPARHVAGYVDLVRRKCAQVLDETAGRYLEGIAGAARRMGQLIDALLAFSQIARVEVRHGRVDLGALVREVRAELGPETAGRSIEWEIGRLPVVSGDPTLLKVVITNLLSNALKFTRGRSPARIAVGSYRATGASPETVLFVRDNGAGFDMQYVHKLFGVFERLHSATDFEGTGIGLATCRRIISRHGGRMWAEGTVDGGATFYLSLPAGARSHATEERDEGRAGAGPAAARRPE